MKFLNKKSGFTLPEMLISVGLFSITIAVTSAIFLIGLRSQRHIIAAINANDNLSYAMEVMARDIRTGRLFFSSIDEEISFLNYRNQAVIYRFNNQNIERSVSGQPFESITSEDIRILDLAFKIEGGSRYDGEQIKVTIITQIASQFGDQEITKNIQTTISPRELEN